MTYKMLAKGPQRLQAEARAKSRNLFIQSQRKDGAWGSPRETQRFGCETDTQVIERLAKLNPGKVFRIAL
jgi:hypothetical protein